MNREKVIINTSIKGIVVNILLVIFKAIVGVIASSIAIILDAINNFTDVLSSVITIIGTKLASKKPDKEHPFGHGRIEYFATLIISIIIMLAGVAALKESLAKIINPVTPNYSIYTIIIVVIATFVKYIFGKYIKNLGVKVNSQSLIASGKDAIFDSVISLSTFIAIILNLIWHISVEGYLGLIISIFIIKSSVEMILDPINALIGIRIDPVLAKSIKKTINEFPKVYGTYDLNITNYGPNRMVGSAHIEVPASMKASEIHKLTREIEYTVYDKFNIFLTLGIYAENENNEISLKIEKEVKKLIKENSKILQIHGLYIDDKNVYFDIIIDFSVDNPVEIRDDLATKLKEKFPEYNYQIVLDADISD